eukprot:g3488.t1
MKKKEAEALRLYQAIAHQTADLNDEDGEMEEANDDDLLWGQDGMSATVADSSSTDVNSKDPPLSIESSKDIGIFHTICKGCGGMHRLQRGTVRYRCATCSTLCEVSFVSSKLKPLRRKVKNRNKKAQKVQTENKEDKEECQVCDGVEEDEEKENGKSVSSEEAEAEDMPLSHFGLRFHSVHLRGRSQQTHKTHLNVASFVSKVISIEKRYAQELRNLAEQDSFFSNEDGSIREAFEAMRHNLLNRVDQHEELARSLESDVHQPLKQSARMYKDSIRRETSEIDKGLTKYNKSRQRFCSAFDRMDEGHDQVTTCSSEVQQMETLVEASRRKLKMFEDEIIQAEKMEEEKEKEEKDKDGETDTEIGSETKEDVNTYISNNEENGKRKENDKNGMDDILDHEGDFKLPCLESDVGNNNNNDNDDDKNKKSEKEKVQNMRRRITSWFSTGGEESNSKSVSSDEENGEIYSNLKSKRITHLTQERDEAASELEKRIKQFDAARCSVGLAKQNVAKDTMWCLECWNKTVEEAANHEARVFQLYRLMWKLQQHCGTIIKDSCRKYVVYTSGALATMQYEMQLLSRVIDTMNPEEDLEEWSEYTAVQVKPSEGTIKELEPPCETDLYLADVIIAAAEAASNAANAALSGARAASTAHAKAENLIALKISKKNQNFEFIKVSKLFENGAGLNLNDLKSIKKRDNNAVGKAKSFGLSLFNAARRNFSADNIIQSVRDVRESVVTGERENASSSLTSNTSSSSDESDDISKASNHFMTIESNFSFKNKEKPNILQNFASVEMITLFGALFEFDTAPIDIDIDNSEDEKNGMKLSNVTEDMIIAVENQIENEIENLTRTSSLSSSSLSSSPNPSNSNEKKSEKSEFSTTKPDEKKDEQFEKRKQVIADLLSSGTITKEEHDLMQSKLRSQPSDETLPIAKQALQAHKAAHEAWENECRVGSCRSFVATLLAQREMGVRVRKEADLLILARLLNRALSVASERKEYDLVSEMMKLSQQFYCRKLIENDTDLKKSKRTSETLFLQECKGVEDHPVWKNANFWKAALNRAVYESFNRDGSSRNAGSRGSFNRILQAVTPKCEKLNIDNRDPIEVRQITNGHLKSFSFFMLCFGVEKTEIEEIFKEFAKKIELDEEQWNLLMASTLGNPNTGLTSCNTKDLKLSPKNRNEVKISELISASMKSPKK